MAKQNLVNLVNSLKESLGTIASKFNDYQQKNDVTLATSNKTVVGGINENKGEIDTLKSQMTNKVDTSTLTNYPTRTEVTDEINNKMSTKLEYKIVDNFSALEPTGQTGVVYLVKNSSGDYDEYMWNTDKSAYDKIGSQAVDLSNYYNKQEVDTELQSKQTEIDTLKTTNETLKSKINEIINGRPTSARVVVTSSDDGLNFTISAFDGVDQNRISIYIMGTKAYEGRDYTISGTSLVLLEQLLEDQYLDYEIAPSISNL